MDPLAEWTDIPHACEPETQPTLRHRVPDARIIGVDIARCLALVGMIAVHLLSDTAPNGAMSLPFILAAGKSAALFALLAGVGLAFSTGRTQRPRGRRWVGAVAGVTVRAVLIAAVGLALGSIIPPDKAEIILVSYAAMFLFAVFFLRLPPGVLVALAGIVALGGPVLSHVLRTELPTDTVPNPSFPMLLASPSGTVREVLLTGAFPALVWFAYVLAGMAVGRLVLSRRRTAIGLTTVGALLAVAANGAAWFLMDRMGGREALAAAAHPIMERGDYADLLVWGASGTLPTNSPWWLAVLAPHTSTPVDIVFTLGIALAVLGLSLTLGLVTRGSLRPLARFGSMPLSVYVLHLLLLVAPFLPETNSGVIEFAIHIALLGGFALLWRHFFRRGPLEQVLWWAARGVSRPISGQRIRP
ncbi:heparan-alpha-glucosaminide N-acetyltransferase domain-containing protein [Granulicoccus sp. GXG6511]|uniref:heparan-alpha-glucosaminide N-acetyltransferase domain-containing protein n=1 Tax=Granulicoccus sp. GXG6511 TaxID=3381351 RepID=UPI003D7D4F06